MLGNKIRGHNKICCVAIYGLPCQAALAVAMGAAQTEMVVVMVVELEADGLSPCYLKEDSSSAPVTNFLTPWA